MMNHYAVLMLTFVLGASVNVNASLRSLVENDDHPTSRELFLNLCGRKIGRLFKKCRDDDDDEDEGKGGKGGGMMGMGKRSRHRRAFEDREKEDLLMFIDALSSGDKKRVLEAVEQGDDETINAIFDSMNKKPSMVSVPMNGNVDEPTSRELFLNLCGRKIGRLFKKCRDDDDEDEGKGGGMMGMGMGKRGRHRRTFEGYEKNDVVMFIDSLSSGDKTRLLAAVETHNDGAVDSIFDRHF